MSITKSSAKKRTKRNAERLQGIGSDVLPNTVTNKHHRMGKRKSSLVEEPAGLAAILKLANLVPDALLKNPQVTPPICDILDWQFGVERRETAEAVWRLGMAIPDEFRVNTIDSLWWKLSALIDGCPPALQAFVLSEDQRYGSVDRELQVFWGLVEIEKRWAKFAEIVQSAKQKIEELLRIEREDRTNRRNRPVIGKDAAHLVMDARDRLIQALAIRELVQALMRKNSDALYYLPIYYRSSAAVAHPLIDADGLVRFTPPLVTRLLDGVNAERIRECPRCFNFFWAGRKDMTGCSTRCANALRMRKLRNPEPSRRAFARESRD